MSCFFIYILKSATCLALFYLFYKLLMTRETFHRINRIALLLLIAFSVIIPLIHISVDVSTTLQQQTINFEPLLMPTATPDSSVSWFLLLVVIYFLGVFFFFVQIFYSVFKVISVMKKGERIEIGNGIVLVLLSEPVAPFSWLKYVVMSRENWEENGNEIMAHEQAHIWFNHSYDLLFSYVCVVFQWFNPAAWLLKQELENIHEYEADESVIKQGIDANKYQLLLIKKAVGTERFISMTNNFNQSKLKNRITMMLKRKSSPWAYLKYLYILPAAALAVTAFARPEVSNRLEKLSEAKVTELMPKSESILQVDSLKESEKIFRVSDEENPPVVYIDDVEVDMSVLTSLDPSTIESVNVLKGNAAEEKLLNHKRPKASGIISIKTKKTK